MERLTIVCMSLLAQAGTTPPTDETDPKLYYGMLLIACAVILGIVEIFVPSGALLAIGAAVSALAGVVLLFMVNTTFGLIGAVIVLAGAIVIFAFALRILPDTPIVKWLALGNETSENPMPGESDAKAQPNASGLVEGDEGVALSDLRPIGNCNINGKRVECLAGTRMIEKGQRVRIVSVDGMQIKVRPAE